MKHYPEYKESGVEWIGEIPRHWNLSMLKYMARLVYGDTLISENRDNGTVPVYGSNGIIDVHSSANTLSPTIIVGRKGSLGKIQYSDVPCFVIDTAYFIDKRTSHVNLRWLHYVLQVLKLERFRDSVIPGLKRDYTEGQYVPLITEEEQTQIANFLDRKTGQIDELIRIKERRIELLQEQRTVLINQAVTKGLDPNVEMKPSGVEWLGEIPAHWEVLKVKHVGSSNPSKNNPKTDRLKDKLVVFLPMERVHTDGTIDQELRHPYSQLKNGYTYFEENDILIAKVTPCFENGKIVLIKNLATPIGFGSTEFIVIRPNPQKVFTPFLYYILYNAPLRRIGKHFMTSAVGLKRVPTEFVENFRIPIPTYQEQKQIANFLDRKIQQIDELIAAEQRKIELLKEYRQSLISEAVTGKIDVRNEV